MGFLAKAGIHLSTTPKLDNRSRPSPGRDWRGAVTYRIGIDVGGTFTDLVAIDPAGVTTLAKVPSPPEDPSIGVLDGLQILPARLGLTRAALLGQPDRIVHGTPAATNALLEPRAARL